MTINREFRLVRRPVGEPVHEDFALVKADMPVAPQGGVLMRNHYISLDPAQRGWMDDEPSYMPPIALGDAIRATTIGKIVESNNPDFQVGDWALGLNRMEDYSACEPDGFTNKIDVTSVPSPTMFLSGMGAVGLTAYFGLLREAKPKPGDTVLVTAAAGAVGSVVGQIAKIKECTTIGIAGGPDKCRRLLEDYGYDYAIDYRGKTTTQLADEIRAVAPDGVNIIFENVGGVILDAGLLNLAQEAHIVMCGLISEYNSEERIGARNLWQLIATRSTMKGFLIAQYVSEFMTVGGQMADWQAAGKLRIDEDIQEGLENSYEAFMRLFRGENTGKLILKIT